MKNFAVFVGALFLCGCFTEKYDMPDVKNVCLSFTSSGDGGFFIKDYRSQMNNLRACAGFQRSFKVASAIMAKSPESIQKRTTIWVSVQPFFSK